MVRDISSSEVTSSIGESGVPYSDEFQSRIIRHVMDKYNISRDEARKFVARAKGQGAYQESEFHESVRRQKQR